MSSLLNKFGQPIGVPVPDWKPRCPPTPVILTGRTCRLEPFDLTKHTNDLFTAFNHDDSIWTYLYFGPFQNAKEFYHFMEKQLNGSDQYYAVIDLRTNKPVGMIAFKGADPTNGVVEAGRAVFSPLLKQSILSTETHYLMMAYVFDQLGYRRYEWSAKTLNAPAKKSVTRLGFVLEGVFRKFVVEKGHSADVARFSIIDDEWPVVKKALETWLAPENFDKLGRQLRKLEDIRDLVRRNMNRPRSHL